MARTASFRRIVDSRAAGIFAAKIERKSDSSKSLDHCTVMAPRRTRIRQEDSWGCGHAGPPE